LIDQSDGSHLAAEFIVFGKPGKARGVERRPDRTGLDIRPEVPVILNGDTLGLMNHPRFRRLVSRVAADPVIE
jgi:hypothetical protein